jgi:hypothetical protein
MKSATFTLVAALSASRVAAHATFQDLWINGVDQGEVCVRLPQSNSPLQDVTSNNIRCNINNGAVAGRCAVKAGDTVSVEMHQQNGDRTCTLSSLTPEAIGGAHWGPVHAYMSKVSDARTADGSTPFFKIFANTWSPANNGAGDNDWWGVKDMQNCCGRGKCKKSSPIHVLLRAILTPSSRRQDPHRHRARRLPAACRSHRTAHCCLTQPSTILHFVLPDYRLGRWQRYAKWCTIPWRLQEHRPRNPRRHSRQDEHLRRPWPNCLRWRRLQDSWQLEVHRSGRFRGSWWKAGERCKSSLLLPVRRISID